MNEAFAELDEILDRESWEWLSENVPTLAGAIEKLVARGLTAEEIRRRVLQRMGAHREPLAKRCENAARFLGSVSAQRG